MSRGFVCLVQNNSTVNYMQLAKLQCLNLKSFMPSAQYAVVTDKTSAEMIDHDLFDHVILMPTDWAKDQEWKQRNDWQLYALSPFTQTIKVEADLLFTRNIDHWWRMLEKQDVVLSLGCRDYQGNVATARDYRKQFDLNALPDIYSGLMYWRRSRTASDLFALAKQLYWTWDQVKDELVQCTDPGSNDMIFACAAALTGVHKTTLPAADFFNFVHLKPAINKLKSSLPVVDQLNIEIHSTGIRINGREQLYPVHYHDKHWGMQALKYYEHTSSL